MNVYKGQDESTVMSDSHTPYTMVVEKQEAVFMDLAPYITTGFTSCPYCGNKSGRTDERGNCISCGAP